MFKKLSYIVYIGIKPFHSLSLLKQQTKKYGLPTKCISAFVFLLVMVAEKSLATDVTCSWNGLTVSNTCAGGSANYTLKVATANVSSAAIPLGKTVVVTFPSGFTLNTITGGTYNGTAISAITITTTATTVSFSTPLAVARNIPFNIVLNGITNSNSAGTYQLSMTIDNTTGTGSGNQDIFAASLNSRFTINARPTPTFTTSPGTSTCTTTDVTYTTQSGLSNYVWSVAGTLGADYTITSGGTGSTSNTVTLQWLTTGSKTVTVNYNNSSGCSGLSAASNTTTVNARPTPTFTTSPGTSICANADVTYTTQLGQSSYIWNVPGTLGVDYTITSGGTGSTSNTVTLQWLTTGSKTVTVNYNNSSGCSGLSAASNTTTVNARPTPTFTTSPGVNVCAGTDVTYTTKSGQSNYVWSVPGTLGVDYTITSGGTGSTSNTVTLQWLTTGSKTVTVNYNNSSGCSGLSAASNTTTVNPKPNMTSSNTATICSGSTASIALTSDIASSYTWVATDNPNTTGESTTTQTSSTLSNTITNNTSSVQTVTYTVTPTSTAGGCTGTSQMISITVNPLPQGSLNANGPFCSTGAGQLTWTATVGTGPFTVVYNDGIANRTQSNVTSGTPFNVFTTPVTTTTTYTLISVTDGNGCTRSSGFTLGSATITIYTPPAITVQPAASQTICNTYPISFTVTATGDGLTYQWYKGTTTLSDNDFITGSNAATLTIDPTDITDAGTYYVVVSGLSPCSSVTSTGAILNINRDIIITNQPASQTLCAGSTATFSIAATGTSLTYQWRKGTTNLTDGGNISGSNTSTLTIANISASDATTSTSKYNVVITDAGASTCPTAFSNRVNLVVNPTSAAGTVSSDATVCSGSNNGTLTLSGQTGNVIRWESSTNGGSTWTTIANTTTSQTYTNLIQATQYRAVVQSGVCPSVNSSSAKISIDPVSVGGTLSGSTTVCAEGNSGTITLSGYTGNIIRWESSTNGGSTWTTIANTTASQTYTNLTQTTRYRVVVQSGVCSSANSSTATITVDPLAVGGALSPAAPLACTGSNNGTITLSGQTGSVLKWESSTNGGGTWSTIANTNSTQTYNNLTQTTVYRATVKSGICPTTALSSSAIVIVNPAFTPTASANPTSICLGESSILTASGYTTTTPMPTEDFQTANPAGWVGYDASGNSTKPNKRWAETDNHKIFNGITYNSDESGKMMIVTGTTDLADSISILSYSSFSLVGMSSATLKLNQAFNLNSGTTIKVEISIDGGATYTTLQQYTGPLNLGVSGSTADLTLNQASFPLTGFLGQSNVMIRFYYKGTAGSNWAIDNIGVTSVPQPITYTWSPSTYLSATTGQTVTSTPTIVGTYVYTVTATTGACSGTANVSFTVNPLPNISGVSASNGCDGSTVTITLTGILQSSISTFIYNINGGISDTAAVLANASGVGTFTVPVTIANNGQKLNIIQIIAATDANKSTKCSRNLTLSVPLVVNPLPTAIISGATSLCQNSAAPVITFTGANGTAPYTFTYKINGGTNQTVTTSSGNSVTVSVPTSAVGTFIYSLVSVQDASSTACSQTQTGSATVVVNPLPTAAISGTTSVCQNSASPFITFTGANGTAPYTFTYKINSGANQTVTTTSGNSVTVSVPTSTVGTIVYSLVSVQDGSSTACSQTQTGIATVAVNPLPTATINGATSVCQNSASPFITFTGAGGTAPYTFTYKINGGANQTITTTSGNSVTVSVLTTTAGTFVYSLVSVQDASSTACSQTQTGSATVVVNPLPTAAISGTTSVCQNSASPDITFTGANGTAPYTFTYKINGDDDQTATTTSGNSVTVPVPMGTVGTFVYSLVSVQDASSTACSQTQTGSATVVINPLPTATISGATSVCQNSASPLITFTGADGTAPYTFTYNINGGADQTVTTTSGNSVTVSVPISTAGTFVYSLVSVQDASSTACSQDQTASATVIVNPAPTASISGDATICSGQPVTLTITVSGVTGPVSGTLSDGTAFSGVAPTILVNINPTSTTAYTINSLIGGASCAALSSDLTGTATVTCLNGPAGLWTGAVDKDWFNCANWADGKVPTIDVNVTIDNTASNPCEIDASISPYVTPGTVAYCKNITIDNNTLSFIAPSEKLFDAGNVTIKNSATVDMTLGGTIELQGNWHDRVSTAGKGFKDGIGSVIFSGSATQSISALNTTELFYNLQINKTLTTGLVNLNSNITVDHNLTLTQGIFTTGYNLFTWNNNGGTLTAPEPSYTANSTNYTNSFIATCDDTGTPINVAGPTTPFSGNAGFQIKNVSNTDTYFPVGASFLPAVTGQSPAPNRMMINSQSGSPQDFTVVVNYGDIGSPNGSPVVDRIWYVKAGPVATGLATMQLFFTKRDWTDPSENEIEGGFNYGLPALVQKDYSGHVNNFINLSDPPDINSFISNTDNTEIYAKYTIGISTSLTDGIQQFNRFSVINPINITLPVSITNFKAYRKGKGVQLDWVAQNEINVNYYEAERSNNGIDFILLGRIKAVGHDNSINYSKEDPSPVTGNNFYRIKAIDKDGSVKYSSIAVVDLGNGKTSMVIYPNPVQTKTINMQLNLPSGKYRVLFYNNLGQQVFNTTIIHAGGLVNKNFALPLNINPGSYFIKLFNDAINLTSRFVVE